MTQQHGLAWGALDFVDPNPADAGYLLEACADGTNFGNPKALIQTVRSLLTDGSLAVLEGWDNREIPIHLRISAPDAIAGPALAAGEAALMAELRAESKSPLVYTPPATDAPASYFDVVVAELERDNGNWDEEEALREYRYYLLTLTCLPFARPEGTTVATALPPVPVTPVVTSIDTCDSLTGWSTSAGTISQSSGYIQVEYADTKISANRSGSISMGSTPYLRVTMTHVQYSSGSGESVVTPLDVRLFVNGDGALPYPAVATGPSSVVAGATDYYFLPPASLTAISISTRFTDYPPVGFVYRQRTHQVSRTDTIPGSGTARQLSRAVSVSGSAPTQAAIRLFDATPAALGTEILVHTSRNTAWAPALRPYRTSSATVTSDTAMVSGARNTLASSMVFRIPANLLTEGTYSLMARLNVSTGGAFGWSAKMVSSAGATTVGSSVVTSGSVTVGVTSGYQVINLAALPLPVVKAEADQMVELTLTGTSNMTVDEVWLFGLHDGVLTWLRDADSLTWIEIRSPELGAARPSIYGGTGAKGANSIDVSWKAAGGSYGSFGAHRFEPGLMQIFTVTSTSLVSQSEIEFYPRYHSHVEAA